MQGMTSSDPGLVYLQVPGCLPLALNHFLSAVLLVREDFPGARRQNEVFRDCRIDPAMLDSQSALAGFFDGDTALAVRYPEVLADPRFHYMTAIGNPLSIRVEVYRHLIATDPSLRKRRPNVFGSIERFLLAGSNAMTRGLCAALGVRSLRVEHFLVVALQERMEESLRVLVERLGRIHESPGGAAGLRIRSIASACASFQGRLEEVFVGAETPSDVQIPREIENEFRARNAADYGFYEKAAADLECPSRIARRRPVRFGLRRRAPVSKAPMEEPVFVFNHLPKCYGSSIRFFLRQGFAVLEDHTRFLGQEGALRDAPVETGCLTADTVLCGHFCRGEYHLEKRYPEVWKSRGRFHLFTFLRDPLQTAISNYLHVKERYPETVRAQPELYEAVERYLMALKNPIAERLGCAGTAVEETLSRYFYIGVAERHEESVPELLARMAAILEAAPQSASVRRGREGLRILRGGPLPHSNRRVSDAVEVPIDVQQAFRENNSLDYRIYRRAVEALEEKSAQRTGAPMESSPI